MRNSFGPLFFLLPRVRAQVRANFLICSPWRKFLELISRNGSTLPAYFLIHAIHWPTLLSGSAPPWASMSTFSKAAAYARISSHSFHAPIWAFSRWIRSSSSRRNSPLPCAEAAVPATLVATAPVLRGASSRLQRQRRGPR